VALAESPIASNRQPLRIACAGRDHRAKSEELMNRVAVGSTSIAEIGYDQQTQTLEIQFRHGGVYQYFDVPVSVHEDLMAAPSQGRYLLDQIKGRYRYARV